MGVSFIEIPISLGPCFKPNPLRQPARSFSIRSFHNSCSLPRTSRSHSQNLNHRGFDHVLTASAVTSGRFPITYSNIFLDHNQGGRTHPERPERLLSCKMLITQELPQERIEFVEPRDFTQEVHNKYLKAVCDVHYEDMVNDVKRCSERARDLKRVIQYDADTYINASSYEVAIRAAGAWMEAVDQVMNTKQGQIQQHFVLTRPPGHHATPTAAMGFCLFNNAAIAAKYALENYGCSSVAVLDWDVHHGNGTEAFAKGEPRIKFTSSHQYPFYPGTGDPSRQSYPQNILNIPLPAGTSYREYKPKFVDEMLPFVVGSKRPFSENGKKSSVQESPPDLVIVSAGYDALDVDPIGGMNLTTADFGDMTNELLTVMQEVCGHQRVVFGLEGGYDLDGVARAVVQTIGTCLK